MRLRPLGLLLIPCASCVSMNAGIEPLRLAPPDSGVTVTIADPVRASLADGGAIVFPRGARISATFIEGEGRRFDLGGRPVGPVGGIALDSVVAGASFPSRVRPAPTVAGSLGLGAIAGVALYAAVMLIAIGQSRTTW
jgi:hypothetical protein